ncbi:hypothetical protein LWI29_007405 [Acer saccharum]|uniref:Uncharacterized protein n=1 Tax=Acer saccharum TaxID=4024 RepID=A0AA39RXP8_ACESA|nr:hypothetical protein LWI29_007405 [Acer saccharum]
MFEEAFQAKVDDPGSFVIPISVGGSELLKEMLDLGASINMMPLALYEKLGLVGLEPTRKKLMLVDRTTRAPHGEIKDIPILVDGIVVPTDFMVLNIEEKSNGVATLQVLLGRPFMATTQMKIDVCKRRVVIHSSERELELDSIAYNNDPKSIGSCNVVDVQPLKNKGGKVRPTSETVVERQNEKTTTQNQNDLPPRRSGRVVRQPTRYGQIGEAQVAISDLGKDDPLTYRCAMEDSDKENWQQAMNLEMESMYSNSVWKLVDLPEGVKP